MLKLKKKISVPKVKIIQYNSRGGMFDDEISTSKPLDVLLTALHLMTFISVINQIDAKNFCFTINFISCLYMFRAHVLIIRRSKLHYTAAGIITAIGGRLVHSLREDSLQNKGLI